MQQKQIPERNEPEPRAQALMDNFFLLTAVGLGIPLIVYIVWSVIDLLRVPPFVP